MSFSAVDFPAPLRPEEYECFAGIYGDAETMQQKMAVRQLVGSPAHFDGGAAVWPDGF